MTGRLVVGVDAESAAATAAEWATGWAARTGESLVLVTATAFAVPPSGTVEALESAHRTASEALGEERVEQRLITEAPSVPEALIDEADDDLIVIGHHRTRALRSALRGWLPLDIALQATGPVVIVPDDLDTSGERIVVGTQRDGSSRAAIAFAMLQAELTGLPVDLLLAEKMARPGSALDIDHLADELRRDHPGVEITATLAEGDAAAAIVDLAQRAALVVVGRHPATPLEDVLVGATGHRLMKKSRAPICVVPPGPEIA